MDYLAAIAKDPDDLALRAVWADALLEAGDPRGEFVALQLAEHQTYATWCTEAALIQEHGEAWAGSLARFYHPRTWRFARGVFVGGRFVAKLDEDALLADPAWPLVTTVVGDTFDRLRSDPRSHVARVVGLAPSALAAFMQRPRPGVVEVGLANLRELLDLNHPITHCSALPDLRELGVGEPSFRTIEVLRDAPVLERLTTLRMDEVGAHGFVRTLAYEVAQRAGALRTIELRYGAEHHDAWRVRLLRDRAPGPFTRIVAWYHPPRARAQAPHRLASACADALALCDLDDVREIDIEIGDAEVDFRTELLVPLVDRLARMPKLERAHVPWQQGY